MYKIGKWLSAALEDPNVCKEMKKDIIEWFENGGDDFNDTITRLRAEIERKDEAIVKAKLEIEKQRTWTGQAWKQNHISDAIANKIHRYLEQALQNKESET